MTETIVLQGESPTMLTGENFFSKAAHAYAEILFRRSACELVQPRVEAHPLAEFMVGMNYFEETKNRTGTGLVTRRRDRRTARLSRLGNQLDPKHKHTTSEATSCVVQPRRVVWLLRRHNNT